MSGEQKRRYIEAACRADCSEGVAHFDKAPGHIAT